jgi:hypothetical protein
MTALTVDLPQDSALASKADVKKTKDKPKEMFGVAPSSLMPLEDPIYIKYLDTLQKFAPTATFFTEFPYKAIKTFNGGIYSFLVSVPCVVPSHRTNGVVLPVLINRMMLASIIKPPAYEEILKYPRPEEMEHLEFWRREIQSKNPEYFELQQYCKNRNIMMFETLYIDYIRDKIAELHSYEDF